MWTQFSFSFRTQAGHTRVNLLLCCWLLLSLIALSKDGTLLTDLNRIYWPLTKLSLRSQLLSFWVLIIELSSIDRESFVYLHSMDTLSSENVDRNGVWTMHIAFIFAKYASWKIDCEHVLVHFCECYPCIRLPLSSHLPEVAIGRVWTFHNGLFGV